MRCASDSSNGGLLDVLLYMSYSLSSLRLSIVQIRVPSSLCSVVRDGFVGCCASSYLLVGWMSISGLIGVVKNVRLVDLHPSVVMGFTWGVLLLTWRGFCVLRLYACKAVGPLSLSMVVESSCQAGPKFTSYSGLPSTWSSGCMCLLVNPSVVQVSICSWVSISGLHWLTKYVVCLWR